MRYYMSSHREYIDDCVLEEIGKLFRPLVGKKII